MGEEAGQGSRLGQFPPWCIIWFVFSIVLMIVGAIVKASGPKTAGGYLIQAGRNVFFILLLFLCVISN